MRAALMYEMETTPGEKIPDAAWHHMAILREGAERFFVVTTAESFKIHVEKLLGTSRPHNTGLKDSNGNDKWEGQILPGSALHESSWSKARNTRTRSQVHGNKSRGSLCLCTARKEGPETFEVSSDTLKACNGGSMIPNTVMNPVTRIASLLED